MKLDERMKKYEYVTRNYLTNRTPVIIRLDGKAFHSFTKGFIKPFDTLLVEAMQNTMLDLCMNIPTCKFGYVQSDEISLLLLDTDNLETQPWFGNNISKIISISAAMATQFFNKNFQSALQDKFLTVNNFDTLPYENKLGAALFDSRAFNIPMEEVNNYFIWRQQDCIRNAIQMVGQSNFSYKELQCKNCKDIIQMLLDKGIKFEEDFPIYLKRGTCAYKTITEYNSVKVDNNYYKFTEKVTRKIWELDETIPNLIEDKTFIKEKITND